MNPIVDLPKTYVLGQCAAEFERAANLLAANSQKETYLAAVGAVISVPPSISLSAEESGLQDSRERDYLIREVEKWIAKLLRGCALGLADLHEEVFVRCTSVFVNTVLHSASYAWRDVQEGIDEAFSLPRHTTWRWTADGRLAIELGRLKRDRQAIQSPSDLEASPYSPRWV